MTMNNNDDLLAELNKERKENKRLLRELAFQENIISSYKQSVRFQENLYSMVKKQKDEQSAFYIAELKKAIDNAECANRAKSHFLADMSHEIRAPLTVIATGIDFADARVQTGVDTAGIRNALDIVRNEIQRLGRMVGGMLDLASMSDTGVNRKRVDFAALLRAGAETFRLTMEKQNNDMVVDIAPGLPDVYVGTDSFTQIMTNLFANAARHTKDGQVILTAEYDETFITVRVTDTGEGILPEILPRVFERGVSGTGNTGYGLYISKTIVEAHGGAISIKSQPGGGTAVTFTVPVYGGQEAGHKS